MAEKSINYTPEQTAALVKDYQAGTTVDELADKYGKSSKSIVSKLSSEGVYVSKVAKAKAAKQENKPHKAELVDQIAAGCGTSAEQFESLEKANRDVLELIAKALADKQAAESADNDT